MTCTIRGLLLSPVLALLASCGGGNEKPQVIELTPVITEPMPTISGIASGSGAEFAQKRAAATTILDSQSVLRNQHTASWAYFMDPTRARWYTVEIGLGKKDVYSLGPMENGRESWWRVGTSATSILNTTQYAATDGGLQTWSSTPSFWALTGGEWVLKWDSSIVQDRELIQNTTTPVAWYFFRAPNFAWYIVNTRHWGADSQLQVLKFGASSDGKHYEWSPVTLDGAEAELNAVPGGMNLRFKSRLIFPLALPPATTIASSDAQLFNTGFAFLQDAGTTYSICAATNKRVTQHPGIDINRLGTSGNGDDGTEVLAIYDGQVVGVNSTVGSVVIKHTLSDGTAVWSAHRHMRGITVNEGNQVRRGTTIGLISNVGADLAHLHFELRTSTHPDPGNANYWCGYSGQTDQTLRSWLANPMSFIRAHQ
jgi:hypothetical protein